MKKIISLILLVFLLNKVMGQTELEEMLNQEIWVNSSPEFKETVVPEKWKNESAVILAMSFDYVHEPNFEKVAIHVRIKLQDKASVAQYSEMEFDKNMSSRETVKSASYYKVGIKVIKPNGVESQLDLSKAVKTDAGSSQDLKVAVPNLEPGDILDYYVAMKKSDVFRPTFSEYLTLEEKFPIVKRTYRFTLPQKMEFFSSSYNGAPEFKEEAKGKFVVYTLVDEMRDKSPELIWNYPHRTSPEIRYRVIYYDPYSYSSNFNARTSSIKALERFDYNLSDIGFIEDFMRANFKTEKDTFKLINELYQLLRNPIYLKAYYNIDQGNPMEMNSCPDLFFYLFNKYLIKYKIPHQILVVPSRAYGPFKTLVNLNTCEYMIRIKSGKPIYISRLTPFSMVNDVPYALEGMNVADREFAISDNFRQGADSVKLSSKEENSTTSNFTVNLNADDNSKINVKRNVLSKGHNKVYDQEVVFTNYDYLKEYDQPKYQEQSSHLLRDLLKQYNIEKQKLEQRLKQDYDARDARIKKDLENEMDAELSDYKNLLVKSIGMWYDSPNLEYSDEFILENMTKKAGPNLIVELGKLIGEQTEVKEEQRKRTRDIYMTFPREFKYEIFFDIPDGYSVEGIEKFNKNVQNDHGGFISSAVQEGKTLIVKTHKYYNKNYYPSAEWGKILEFLDAAVEFQKEKILLKKQ